MSSRKQSTLAVDRGNPTSGGAYEAPHLNVAFLGRAGSRRLPLVPMMAAADGTNFHDGSVSDPLGGSRARRVLAEAQVVRER